MNAGTHTVLVRNDSPPAEQSRHPRHLHPSLELKYIQVGISRKSGYLPPIIDNWILQLPPDRLVQRILAPPTPGLAIIRGDSSCIDQSLVLASALHQRGVTTLAVGQQVSHVASLEPPGWHDAFDISLLGEPEHEAVRIAVALATTTPAAELRQKYMTMLRNRQPVYVADPDSLPNPVWTPADLRQHPFPFPVRGPVATKWGYVQTAWGCPHSERCRFCSDLVRKSSGSRLRPRTVDRVVEEVSDLLDAGAQAICFEDNSILSDRRHFLDLCSEFARLGLRFPWIASARIDEIDDETAEAAAEHGAALFKLGIESGSPRILQSLGKCTDGSKWPDQVRKADACLAKYNVGSVGLVMVGCPDESEEEAYATLSLLCELDLDYIQVQVFAMYPDSLYCRELAPAAPELAAARGNIYHYSAAGASPSQIAPARLLALQHEFYRRFYLRPVYLRRHLRRFWRWYLYPPTAAAALRSAGPKVLQLIVHGGDVQ